MAFHVRTKSGQYTENMKCETNVALNHKNEILDRKDELYDRRDELKQNMIVSEENECEYVTPTGAVPDFNTPQKKVAPNYSDEVKQNWKEKKKRYRAWLVY